MYSYARDNPVKYNDPSGEYVETALDLASFAYSVNEYYDNPTFANAVYMGLDGAALALPFLPAVAGHIRMGGRAVQISGDIIKDAKKVGKLSGSEMSPEQAKAQLDDMLKGVENDRLGNAIKQLFRPGDKLPGGTAGVLKYERKTGTLLSPSGHAQKAQDRINSLKKILTEEKLTKREVKKINGLINSLTNALNTKKN